MRNEAKAITLDSWNEMMAIETMGMAVTRTVRSRGIGSVKEGMRAILMYE